MRRKNKNTEVYAFIDNQNVNVSIKNMGWKMDWRKLRQFLKDKYGVTKAYMFIGYVPEYEDMYMQMHDAGYLVVLKPTFDMTKARPEDTNGDKPESEEKRPIKGNIDAELVLWVMRELPNYSKAVIVSGDGDFYSVVEYLEEMGKLGTVLAPTYHYSKLYNKYENYIERLDQHKRELAYRPNIKKPRPQQSQAPQQPQSSSEPPQM
jgi:uncharacterized LabA/DUF88 family protein